MDQTQKIGQTYYPKTIKPSPKNINPSINSGNPFNQILENTIRAGQEVKFSSHAKQRLDIRGIHLDSKAINELNHAVDKAAQKGVKDSLILMKDLAFVVNVPNRVVVTTVDEASMKEHIFTNIDGAIIL